MSKLVLKQHGEEDEEIQAKNLIQPGMFLYGFLGGLFGRDAHGVKKVVEVHSDYIIAMEDGYSMYSRTVDGKIYKWSAIVKESNRYLKELEDDGFFVE